MPAVSVIMPSLNVAKYIDKSIESVRNQTLEDIEIICVDAGSTDGTLEIIQKHAAEDSRIRIINADRQSYGYQMNLGIDAATGDYIGIVETDDFIPETMYEDLYLVASLNEVDVLKSDFYRFKEMEDGYDCLYTRIDQTQKFYTKIFTPATRQKSFRMVMNTWSGLYNRTFLKENNIRHNETPGASYQDNGFWFQTFVCAERVMIYGKPYYMNRRDNEGSSMLSKGKVGCITEEYEFIKKNLEERGRFEEFTEIYCVKKYHNHMATARRIDAELRQEYFEHIASEMKPYVESGACKGEFFTPYEWDHLQLLLKDPKLAWELQRDGFYSQRLHRRWEKMPRLAGYFKKRDELKRKFWFGFSWFQFYDFNALKSRYNWQDKRVYISKEEI